jgi:hypothetical protein
MKISYWTFTVEGLSWKAAHGPDACLQATQIQDEKHDAK